MEENNVINSNNSSNTACDAPFKDNNSNQQEKSNTMQLFDHFAAVALQALITKLPLQDRDGEFAEAKTEDEINEIKKDLCEASYNYAWHMMKAREGFEPYFKQFNSEQNPERSVATEAQ